MGSGSQAWGQHVIVGTVAVVVAWLSSSGTGVMAADTGSDSAGPVRLEEIVVTARKREENLQSVPDAITAFTSKTIVNAGIEQFEDFAALTPSLNFDSGCAFECEQAVISMRGIKNGQQGWPSISYIVDGVPADSLDSIMSGSLEDIDRIEVLRGPQSALYGFNAIAGAINVVTKAPTNDWQGDARLLYGNGANVQAAGDISGALIPDKLLFRLDASYRNDHGLIRSVSNGLDLDFNNSKQARVRFLITPIESFTIDLRASIDREHQGAVFEDKVPSLAFLNDYSGRYANAASRAVAGAQDRALDRYVARIQYDFDWLSLISLSAFSHTDQAVPPASICFDDPNDPQVPLPTGGAACAFGPAFGRAAPPGAPVDNFYSDLNNFRTFTEDFRLASRANGPLEWTFGASVLHRYALEGFDSLLLLAPATLLNVFPSWHDKVDNWWGVYGQLIWNATSKWQFTAAARYDNERYASTGYSGRDATIIVPTPTLSGPVNTQRQDATAFQPKAQVSYHITTDIMGYATVSRGFRAGYFFNGSYTQPEHTTNYELGVKSTLADRRVLLNGDVFYIDYSNQQVTNIIPMPPFQVSSTIPKTRIEGAELESTVLLSRFVTFGLGASYLDARVGDDTDSPFTPKFQINTSADVSYPIRDDWKVLLHLDDRYNTFEYLGTENQQYRGPINLLNARLGVENGRYNIAAFVRNAADRRYTTSAGTVFGNGFIRFQNQPRTYGLEVRAHF